MAANPTTFDYWRGGQLFPLVGAKSSTTNFDYWRGGQLSPLVVRSQVSTDPNTLMALANCGWCVIPSGLINYAVLAAIQMRSQGMAVPTDSNQLLARVSCLTCIPSGLLPYVILAAAIDMMNGTPVSDVPNTLMDRAKCLRCIPEGLVPYVLLSVFRGS